MAGDTRSYALDVSELLFRLSTESLRLRSNDTLRFETVASLVNARVEKLPLTHLDAVDVRAHFDVVESKGPVRVHVTLPRSCADLLIEEKRRFAKLLDRSLTMADMISILLFDFVAEHHSKRILGKIGMDEGASGQDKPTSVT